MPFDIASRMLDRSDARADSEDAVKKEVGLSRAVLTFLPVARRSCVVASRLAVSCKESRFCRTPADRVIFEDMFGTFLGRMPYWRRTADLGIDCRFHSHEFL